jgi:nitrous oxide reductase accessory protein NosL
MKKSLVLTLCAAAVLAACGGGDDDATPAATAQVPASASVSAMGLIDYLKLLVASSADTLEPVDVSAVTPQTDDAGGGAVVD